VNVNKSDLFAFSVKVVYCFFNSIAYRTHCNYNLLCIGAAVVVEQLIVAPCEFVYLFHVFFYYTRKGCVEWVRCFFCLEEDVRVLRCTPKHRMLRVKGVIPETTYSVVIYDFVKLIVVHHFYLLHFM
jgi:hypothetical protein